jgi:proteasome lid subunit RPN8/RPN11
MLTGLNAVPRRGAEVGGILIGSRTPQCIVVEDFEPIPSEHRFGPSYVLSDSDRALLVETLDYFRSERPHGLDVVGWYRSHTRAGLDLSGEDRELFAGHFGEGDLMMLVQPARLQDSTAVFFLRESGRARRCGEPERFPFAVAAEPPAPPPARLTVKVVPMPEPAVPEPQPAVPGSGSPAPAAPRENLPLTPEPAAPPQPALTPFRPVRYVPAGARSRRGQHRGLWIAAAAALAALGGLLGFLSLQRPDVPIADNEPQRVIRTVAAPEPVLTPDLRREVEDFIGRWRTALSRGDAEAAAAMYAPAVTRYFRMRNASQADVVATIRAANRRWGRLIRNEISDLRVTPEGPDRAVATFRKTWQTAGPRFFAGEERERLRLVRYEDDWKIASEEELQVYWVRRDR